MRRKENTETFTEINNELLHRCLSEATEHKASTRKSEGGWMWPEGCRTPLRTARRDREERPRAGGSTPDAGATARPQRAAETGRTSAGSSLQDARRAGPAPRVNTAREGADSLGVAGQVGVLLA